MIEIDENVRIDKFRVFKELKKIHENISESIKEEMEKANVLEETKYNYFKKERKFIKEITELFRSIKVGQKVKITTQVGKDQKTLIKNQGKITDISFSTNGLNLNTFNIIDPNDGNGKEFTVGLGCLQSIKLIKKYV